MSALEQEPQTAINVAVATGPPVTVLRIVLGGVGSDTSLSAVLQKISPYKVVRVRGIVWVTGTPSNLSVVTLLSEPSGTPIGSNYSQTSEVATVAAIVPLPFEWVDTAANLSSYYNLNVSATVTTTVSVIANLTGYNA